MRQPYFFYFRPQKNEQTTARQSQYWWEWGRKIATSQAYHPQWIIINITAQLEIKSSI